MRHPSEPFFEPLPLESIRGGDYSDLQRRIGRSNTPPLRPLALAAGIATVLCLAAAAAVLRLRGARAPDAIDRDLGRLYFHVPEMAIHKRIELNALAAAGPSGDGIDIGCGNGYVGGLLKRASRIASLHGVDPVGSFADEAVAHGYAGFTAAEATRVPLADHTFDFAVSICVLEHVRDLDGALREMHRLVKPGGRLFLTTPAPEFRRNTMPARALRAIGLRRAADEAAARRDKESSHFHYHSADVWNAALSEIGFRKIEVNPIFSRSALLVYEILNWSVRLPELYYADKLHPFGRRRPLFARIASWSAAVTAAAFSCRRPPMGEHTHWLITATRGS